MTHIRYIPNSKKNCYKRFVRYFFPTLPMGVMFPHPPQGVGTSGKELKKKYNIL